MPFEVLYAVLCRKHPLLDTSPKVIVYTVDDGGVRVMPALVAENLPVPADTKFFA